MVIKLRSPKQRTTMFKTARVKLTIGYISTIMLITLFFSAIVYINVDNFTQKALEKHERRVETRLEEFRRPAALPPRFQQQISKEALLEVRRNVIYLLAGLNSFIFVTTGGLAYWFAGKTLKPIRRMAEKQKRFIADAAHELKTPLTAMKTHLEVNLRAKKMNKEKFKEIMKSTLEEIDSLTLLTRELLKESKYQEKSNTKNKELFDLTKLIKDTVKKMEPQADSKEINIRLDTEQINTYADKSAIKELLTILLDNAIKFTKNKGQVDISAKKENKKITIIVKDTGIGIDKKDIPYIFDRFYKADTSRTKENSPGFGLGLSIAKHIVEEHKGTIHVTSALGKGTSFKVILPLKSL